MIPGSSSAEFFGAAGAAGGAGYEISRSLRFNSADSAYLNRTPASAGNRKTWTWAGWVKRSNLGSVYGFFGAGGGGSPTPRTSFYFAADDSLTIFSAAASTTLNVDTTAVFRDVSAWYHILVSFDTTQATAANRVRVYVNGTEQTSFATATYPTQNSDEVFNDAVAHNLGATNGPGNYFDGYLADVHFIDGQALDPTSFTEVSATTGQLVPIEYTGTYGTNGFHLPFSDNSTAAALGTDTSGNSNTWTVNNISVAAGAGNDSLVDTPTNYGTDTGAGGEVRGNYATLNPLAKGSDITLSNGNLDLLKGGSSAWQATPATIAPSSGKYYFEYTLNSAPGTSGSYNHGFGIDLSTNSFSILAGFSSNSYGLLILNNQADYYTNSSLVDTLSTSIASGDVCSLAIDIDAGKGWFGVKNSWVGGGNPSSGTTPTFTFTANSSLVPTFSGYASGSAALVNFGQRPFAYTAPSGFKALCTTNLPEPTIADGSTVMDVALYTGNSSTQTISGLEFSPDFVWIKPRSAVNDHVLCDIIRGPGVRLFSNSTSAESTAATSLTSFNSDGFSLGSHSSVNTSSVTYAAWTWDAGSSTVTLNPGDPGAGSITSSVRANASAGFSIVTWTGASGAQTVGHGLGVSPELVIVKSRDGASSWYTYTKSTGAGAFLTLNSTDASSASSTAWDNTAPSSTVVSFNSTGTNPPGEDIVAYCFAPVSSYSAFGSYTGNGSADGPFVYTGFRPAFVLLKCSSTAGTYWTIHDNKRLGYNPDQDLLFPNATDAENTTSYMDFTSNGFKLRIVSSFANASGATFVYAAFAESPFQYARAR